VRPGGAAELDPLAITVDVRRLGISGLQAVEWLRAERQVDLGSGDTFRVNARITHADDDDTQARLVDAMAALVQAAPQLEQPLPVAMPAPRSFELEMGALPRDAFFGRVEQVPVEQAAGRIVAELLSPYPPGVPVLAPGEIINADVVDYLVTGVQAGMLIPDAADPTVRTLRVLAE
jgi:arginine decarboxylase